jgi:hypothetical protein
LPEVDEMLESIHIEQTFKIATNERLSLSELKERGKALGCTKIQRLYTSAKVPLDSWNAFATESGSAYQHVEVYYVLNGNHVAVFKGGKAEAHYILS